MRDKRNQPLRLEGKTVILEEIAPKYFSYVVEWRNNPALNKYLNQPFVLSDEKERDWYENVYLKDDTQGLMIMVDKKNGVAFGTCGWTDLDLREKQCICGRILRGDDSYKGTPALQEALFVLADYLYQFVDVMYAHVVKENIPSLRLHERMGYVRHFGDFQYSEARSVNGMGQIEYYRGEEQYFKIRDEIMQEYR